jgi:hypothetical protein
MFRALYVVDTYCNNVSRLSQVEVGPEPDQFRNLNPSVAISSRRFAMRIGVRKSLGEVLHALRQPSRSFVQVCQQTPQFSVFQLQCRYNF